MSDDRNEGECYGPFHAGFVCEDCADRYRALEAARAEAVARLAEALERWPSVMARTEKAEAALETPKGKHDCPWCAAGRYHLNAHQRDSLGREDERMTYEIHLENQAAAKSAARSPLNDPDHLTTGDSPAMRRAAARMAIRSAENQECGT